MGCLTLNGDGEAGLAWVSLRPLGGLSLPSFWLNGNVGTVHDEIRTAHEQMVSEW